MRRQALSMLSNVMYIFLCPPLRPVVPETLRLAMISVDHTYIYNGKHERTICGCTVNFTFNSFESCLISERQQDITTLNEDDNGKHIEIAQGKTLVLELESFPGTGYGWQIVKVSRKMLQPIGEPTLQKSPGALVGAPAHQVYRFRARTLGSTKLELQYLRVWEKDRAPLKTFDVVVRVCP
jgi:predicted secreted protein